MGVVNSAISNVAFPAPQMPRESYEDLQKRSDLRMITTSKGDRIPACYVKARSGMRAPFTVIYSHSNAEDLALIIQHVDKLVQEVRVDVFAYEYVGYSLSRFEQNSKEPSEKGCIQSIEAAWRYCVDELDIPPKQIIIFGRSIGSGPAIALAAKDGVEDSRYSPQDIGGMVLLSPIESGARVFSSMITNSLDMFKNYEKMRNIKCPVAIIHPTNDQVVPVANGKALHMECKNPFHPLWIENCGHNDVPHKEIFEYMRSFCRFLKPKEFGQQGQNHGDPCSCCFVQ